MTRDAVDRQPEPTIGFESQRFRRGGSIPGSAGQRGVTA